jgi:hypothetical protein
MEDSNSEIVEHRVIKGANKINADLVNKGRRILGICLNQTSHGPISGYKPTQGLIILLNKTGTGRHNPKLLLHSTTLPKKLAPHRRSYVEALHNGMDGGGKYGNGAGNGVRGSGTGGFRGQTQGRAYARAGHQRLYQQFGNMGLYGGRGGGRHYEQQG